MQPSRKPRGPIVSIALQYPQTGRTSGNSRRSTSMTLSYVLAVPSDGSNLRQLTTTAWYHIACTSCSTLRRVEPHATSCYSPTIRLLSVLQYPQTGRTSCNPRSARYQRSKGRTCSTLRRVEPHATGSVQPQTYTIEHLQYPQTGRTSCNADANLALAQAVVLQYPQTGRT